VHLGRELGTITPELLRGISKIAITGCGTAFHAGMVGMYFALKPAAPAVATTAGEGSASPAAAAAAAAAGQKPPATAPKPSAVI